MVEQAVRADKVDAMKGRARNRQLSSDVLIRDGKPADLPGLLAIEARMFPGDRLTARSLRRLMGSASAALLVAEAAGRPAGYALVLLRVQSEVARLYSLARDPELAPRGTGALLLEAAEAASVAHGKTGLRLEVRADNRTAIDLYLRAGYRTLGRKIAYYDDGTDALRMHKDV